MALSKLEIADKILEERKRELSFWQAQLDHVLHRMRITADLAKRHADFVITTHEEIRRIQLQQQSASRGWKKRLAKLNSAVQSRRSDLRLAQKAPLSESTIAKRKRALAKEIEAREAARALYNQKLAKSKLKLSTTRESSYSVPESTYQLRFASREEGQRALKDAQQQVAHAQSEVDSATRKRLAAIAK